MTTLIDGKQAAAELREAISEEVATLRADGVEPTLATVTVGADPASQVYLRSIHRTAEKVGLRAIRAELDDRASQDEVEALIQQLNADESVHGILLHVPLPDQMDERAVVAQIDPRKDVDGVTAANAGALWTGGDALVPSTPLGALLLLQRHFPEGMSGKRAVIVGRSNIVGKPMAALLLAENCTVTIAHSHTKDLPILCRSAEILVVAVGRANMVKGDWVSEDAVVIDVGINSIEVEGNHTLVGDVDFDDVAPHVAAITPVPGGVGPMTIAALLRNTVAAAKR